jgi:hypothetical protein
VLAAPDFTASKCSDDGDDDKHVVGLGGTAVDVFVDAPAWLVTQQYTHQHLTESVLGLAKAGADGSAAHDIARILLAKAMWRHEQGHDMEDGAAVDTIVAYALTKDQAAGCSAVFDRGRRHVGDVVSEFVARHHIKPVHMWAADDTYAWSTMLSSTGAPYMGETDPEIARDWGEEELEQWQEMRKHFPLTASDLSLLRMCVDGPEFILYQW